MKNLLFFVLLFSSGVLQAQSDSTKVRKSGIYSRVSLGILAGETASTSIHVANGYRFGNRIEAGVGLGFERYYYQRFAPLFIESRVLFGKGKSQPFAGITGGYLASLDNNNYYGYQTRSKGYTAGAFIGITHYFTDRFGISTTFGYRFIYTNEPYQSMLWMADLTQVPQLMRQMNRFEMRVGIALR